MYIGQWQEYKLAQVLKTKNDLYELKSSLTSIPSQTPLSPFNPHSPYSPYSPLSLPQANPVHNSTTSLQSARTISSEPTKRPYVKFSIDTYYNSWLKVENFLAKTQKSPKLQVKKQVQKQVQTRKRTGKSIQTKRIEKMREVFGITDRNKIGKDLIGKDMENERGVRNRVVIKEEFRNLDKGKGKGKVEVWDGKKNFADLVVMEKERIGADCLRSGGIDRAGLEDSVAPGDVDWLIMWAENLEEEAFSGSKDFRKG